MNYVYELIQNINVRGVIFTESVGLFSKKQKAIEVKENLKNIIQMKRMIFFIGE